MLRDKNLIPLSHQHQHALSLCVRIERASPVPDTDLDAWQAEIAQHFQSEIGIHFTAEERVLFPTASRFRDLVPLVEELLADHADLREQFHSAQTRTMSASDLSAFAQRLSIHIRKEERQLFERLQELMTPEELGLLGQQLDQALQDAEQSCILPTATTKLQSAK